MFWILLAFFILFLVVDAFLSLAVIFHLYQYTMADWTLGRTIAIAYAAIAISFFVLAIASFSQIPFGAYEPVWRDAIGGLRPQLWNP